MEQNIISNKCDWRNILQSLSESADGKKAEQNK